MGVIAARYRKIGYAKSISHLIMSLWWNAWAPDIMGFRYIWFPIIPDLAASIINIVGNRSILQRFTRTNRDSLPRAAVTRVKHALKESFYTNEAFFKGELSFRSVSTDLLISYCYSMVVLGAAVAFTYAIPGVAIISEYILSIDILLISIAASTVYIATDALMSKFLHYSPTAKLGGDIHKALSLYV
jgi:hypothetical protein